jgi:hypothetical protein
MVHANRALNPRAAGAQFSDQPGAARRQGIVHTLPEPVWWDGRLYGR